jgi:hypothetical protein
MVMIRCYVVVTRREISVPIDAQWRGGTDFMGSALIFLVTLTASLQRSQIM